MLIVEHFDVTDDDMMFDLRTGMHTSESILQQCEAATQIVIITKVTSII